MKASYLLALIVLGLGAVVALPSARAQELPNTVWQYVLLPESQLIDDCDACGRPTIFAPLRGTFQMRLVGCDPLYCEYNWEDVEFTAKAGIGQDYLIEGRGAYRIGGEVALLQTLFLEGYGDPGHTNGLRYFVSTNGFVERLWPMIKISLDQTNPTILQHLHLEISATPMREIWFSTAGGLTAGIWQAPTNHVSGGDLISSVGRRVKDNQQLTARLGIMPSVPDLGLKDMDMLPGGEIAFSIEQDIFSETLGPLTHGDLLTDQGRLLATNSSLVSAFGVSPEDGDLGLDAVQVLDSGEIYFSVQTNFYSPSLSRLIGSGDLLSNHGRVVRSNADLLARFHPQQPEWDFGLAGVYVWPSGEIWFATEIPFVSTNSTAYQAGDLLSDQGYVVYRNLELVAPFQPLEDRSNFGLDALFVVTDVTPSPAADRCTSIVPDLRTGNLTLQYSGQGRVWQLERAETLGAPWEPVSPITTDLPLTDYGVLQRLPQAFYRLHQW